VGQLYTFPGQTDPVFSSPEPSKKCLVWRGQWEIKWPDKTLELLKKKYFLSKTFKVSDLKNINFEDSTK